MEGWFSRNGVLRAWVSTVVLGFELGRGNVAQGAVEPDLVEPVDPRQRGELEVVDVAPGAFVADAFGLVEADDGLGERVVVGIADGPDRSDSAGFVEPGCRSGSRCIGRAQLVVATPR